MIARGHCATPASPMPISALSPSPSVRDRSPVFASGCRRRADWRWRGSRRSASPRWRRWRRRHGQKFPDRAVLVALENGGRKSTPRSTMRPAILRYGPAVATLGGNDRDGFHEQKPVLAGALAEKIAVATGGPFDFGPLEATADIAVYARLAAGKGAGEKTGSALSARRRRQAAGRLRAAESFIDAHSRSSSPGRRECCAGAADGGGQRCAVGAASRGFRPPLDGQRIFVPARNRIPFLATACVKSATAPRRRSASCWRGWRRARARS